MISSPFLFVPSYRESRIPFLTKMINMKRLLLLSLVTIFIVSIPAYSQPREDCALIADETCVKTSGKYSFLIVTTNDAVADAVIRKFDEKTTYHTRRRKFYKVTKSYVEHTFSFKSEHYETIVGYIKGTFSK